jgi:hypothetical protein
VVQSTSRVLANSLSVSAMIPRDFARIAYSVVSVLIGVQTRLVILCESFCSVNATPFVMWLWLRRTSE